MMTDVVSPPPTESASKLLWRTWFDDGVRAIEEKEYLTAFHWLREALRHVCAGGSDDRIHAMTLAHQAYANMLLARHYVSQAEDSSVSQCEVDELQKFADRAIQQACADAREALPRLGYDRDYSPVDLATARAAHVVAETSRLLDDLRSSRDKFKLAASYYQHAPTQTAAIDEVYARLFSLNFQLREFKTALDNLDLLESRVSARSTATPGVTLARTPGRSNRDWLAVITAARAETLIQLGRYLEAETLYDRWKSLVPDWDHGELSPSSLGYECAYGLASFGRAKLILGDYAEAGRLLCRGSSVVESLLACQVVCPEFLPPYDGSLRFDIVLSRAELALNRGEFIETRELLALALAFKPPWIDRRIRHSLVSARYHFAIGRFGDACSCYKAARSLADELSLPRYQYVIPALVGMSHVESETSSWVNSISLATQAVRCLEEVKEPISAEMIDALQALAAAYVRDDRSQEAKPLCDRARSLIAMTLKARHPVEANIQLLIAEYWISRRKADEAIAACHLAGTLFLRHSPCDGFAQSRTLRIEGEAHLVDRHPRCAAVLFGQALCCWNEQEKRLDCMHPEKSLIFLDIALTNISRGAIAEAENQYVMLKPWLCEFKGNAARAGFELNRRGNLLQGLAMYDEADWLYCHAEELYCECYGFNHPFTCQVRANREIVRKRRLEACPPTCVECR